MLFRRCFSFGKHARLNSGWVEQTKVFGSQLEYFGNASGQRFCLTSAKPWIGLLVMEGISLMWLRNQLGKRCDP